MYRHDKTKLKIITWNCNGLTTKQNELQILIEKTEPDVVLLQETRLNKKRVTKIPNYTIYNKPKTANGGLLTYAKNTIDLSKVDTQTSTAEIQLFQTDNLTIANYYLPPTKKHDFIKLDEILSNSDKVIIAGDYNSLHPTWNNNRHNPNGNQLHDFLQSSDALLSYPTNDHTHHSYVPNHRPSTIDLAITKNLTVRKITTLNKLSSDHLPVLIEITSLKITTIPPHKIKITDWKNFAKQIQQFPINPNIHTNDDIEQAISIFTKQITDTYNKNTIEKPPPTHKLVLPPDLTQKIRNKNKLRKIYQTHKYTGLKTQINKLTKDITTAISKIRTDKWTKTLSDIRPQNLKKLWKITKGLKKNANPDTKMPALQTDNGQKNTSVDKANAIAETYLQHHSMTLNQNDPMTQILVQNSTNNFQLNAYPTPPEDLTSPKEIRQIIRKLKNKAPGNDQIRASLIKKFPRKFIVQFYYILNSCLRNQYFPTCWKNATVIPILKPGKPNQLPTSYRPISLLPVLAKILEKLILTRLQLHDLENDTIRPEQFGFRANHSTVLQLATLTDKITKNFNLNKTTTIVTLDIQKAFDTIWQDGLLHKMITTNYPPHLIKLIDSYIKNRTYQVQIKNSLSHPLPIPAGVPQGSLLAPLLFTYYINDLPTHPDTTITLYADDTAISATSFRKNKSIDYLQRHIDLLEPYYYKWKLKLNETKTTLTIFTHKVKDTHTLPLKINNTNVTKTDTVKYLGVTLDQKLTYRHHLLDVAKRGSNAFHALYPVLSHKNGLDLKIRRQLYLTMIRPILTYASPIWSSAAKTNIRHIQVVQNKCLRALTGLPITTEKFELHELADVRTLPNKIHHDAIKFFTITTQRNDKTSHIARLTNSTMPFRRTYKLLHQILL